MFGVCLLCLPGGQAQHLRTGWTCSTCWSRSSKVLRAAWLSSCWTEGTSVRSFTSRGNCSPRSVWGCSDNSAVAAFPSLSDAAASGSGHTRTGTYGNFWLHLQSNEGAKGRIFCWAKDSICSAKGSDVNPCVKIWARSCPLYFLHQQAIVMTANSHLWTLKVLDGFFYVQVPLRLRVYSRCVPSSPPCCPKTCAPHQPVGRLLDLESGLRC